MLPPLLHFDRVNSTLLCMVRGKLCITLAICITFLLFSHMVLLTVFVDRQMIGRPREHIVDIADTELGYIGAKSEDVMNDLSLDEDIEHIDVDNVEKEHVDIVDIAVANEDAILDKSKGSKHLLAEYSYDKDQVVGRNDKELPVEIPNKAIVQASNNTKYHQLEDKKHKRHQQKLFGTPEPPPIHLVETFIVNVETIDSASRRRTGIRKERDLVNLDTIINQKLELERSQRKFWPARDISGHIKDIPQPLLKMGMREHEQQHPQYRQWRSVENIPSASVVEVNIDHIKRDEEWEAGEDMSSEHLIVAEKKTTTAPQKSVFSTTTSVPNDQLQNQYPTKAAQKLAKSPNLLKQAKLRLSLQMRKKRFGNVGS